MAFYEIQFPTDISLNSGGGPKWKTDVIVFDNGFEQRNQRWSEVRSEYDVAYGVKTRASLQSLIAFFNEMRGRAHGFRFKDWMDFEVTDEPLTVDGSPTFQLIKKYGNGFNDYTKDITKPIAGGVSIKKNGSSFTDFSVDSTTGVVTFSASVFSESIVSISHAAQARIQFASAHGRSIGDKIYIDGVLGMTEINQSVGTVTAVVSTTEVDVDIDTTSYTSYSSGGTGTVYCESGDSFTWSGQYDIPCRFDTDSLDINLETYELGAASVPVVEIRI